MGNILMRTRIQPLIFSFTASLLLVSSNAILPKQESTKQNANPKIQVAVLLDVSNSMDGLIEQAKAQLWNMVTVMGKAKCNNAQPQIEIALYEYGRDSNDPSVGYVKQISGFSNDLDLISQNLFNLKTNGGEEYCGQVIYTSLSDLKWDAASSSYKVIFIAGNEDFLQGSLSYTKACEEARKKGVIVNTIYCGDRMQGIREHWNLGAECGTGSFTNINSDEKIREIPTPYDTVLITLNNKLNSTYLYYGEGGKRGEELQMKMDAANASIGGSVAAKRASVKANRNLYDNSGWDLVDAYEKDKTVIKKVDMKTLPENLKNKSREEVERIVVENNKERGAVQKQIADVSIQREAFIAKEKAKARGNENKATLETEIEKTIKEQVMRYNMVIKD
jgi:hypothetical protein